MFGYARYYVQRSASTPLISDGFLLVSGKFDANTYSTNDGGMTWVQRNALGVPEATGFYAETFGSVGGYFYAIASHSDFGTRVVRTNDLSVPWQEVFTQPTWGNLISGGGGGISIGGQDDYVLIAAGNDLAISTDNGLTWTFKEGIGCDHRPRRIENIGSTLINVDGFWGEMKYSSDVGDTWGVASGNPGTGGPGLQGTITPTSCILMYPGSVWEQSLIVSTDDGQTMTTIDTLGISYPCVSYVNGKYVIVGQFQHEYGVDDYGNALKVYHGDSLTSLTSNIILIRDYDLYDFPTGGVYWDGLFYSIVGTYEGIFSTTSLDSATWNFHQYPTLSGGGPEDFISVETAASTHTNSAGFGFFNPGS